jgi:hypothetical protein
MPGPWRSKLKKYQSEIARLRNTIPPTPYVEIARILNDKPYGLGITAGAIWAFVKARDPSRKKKVFKLPDEEPQPSVQPEPSSEQYAKKEEEDDYDRAREIALSKERTKPKAPVKPKPGSLYL